jgi:hypothetical protein
MPAPRDWAGIRQGKLLVIRRMGSRYDGQALWECRCSCGNLSIKSSGNLRLGVKSCSATCGVGESNRNRAITGVAHGKEWTAWTAAKQRCHNPKNPNYKNYGARGIYMHPDWVNDFPAFYAYVGPAPTNDRRSSLDRIDVNGDYEPGNVRWATLAQQASNTRRAITVEVGGKKITSAEACDLYDLPYSTIESRWRKGVRGPALVAPRKRRAADV